VKQHSFWTPQYSSLLRFETEAQLQCLRNILGDATTVGVRMRRPKINSYNSLLTFTKLNVIVGSDNQQIQIRKECFNDRIDFFFNDYDSYIAVSFDEYLVNGTTNANHLQNNCHIKNMMRSYYPNDNHDTNSNAIAEFQPSFILSEN
jgi:hypothetical protein